MISILMPIYNGIEFINDSVESVINQTCTEWELIIGINGHPEGSPVFETAKTYEKRSTNIRVYDFYNLKGKSITLNQMINFCNYNWIALLDVDDKWLPKKLEKQLAHINSYDVIGTATQYFGDQDDIPNLPLGDINNFDFLELNPIINSSCLVKKSLVIWDKNYDGVEDYELWLRLWKQNKFFFNVPEVLVLHRIHNDSAFNAQGNNNKVANLINKYL